MDQKLAEVAAAIERQNAAFDDARNTLEDVPEIALPVPTTLLEELDALTTAPSPAGAAVLGGLRA